ncbi:hypothetical protein [Bradyrhizobium sp. DASA03120]|uniref:hypothetical protein n=1 Tax=Bradyrhizobium sp. SMVTL-02 TaxID=3395917 RepID=UPI003F6E8807
MARAIHTSRQELLRADFFDSDSFFENEVESKPEQSRTVPAVDLHQGLDGAVQGAAAASVGRQRTGSAKRLREFLTKACAQADDPIRLG